MELVILNLKIKRKDTNTIAALREKHSLQVLLHNGSL